MIDMLAIFEYQQAKAARRQGNAANEAARRQRNALLAQAASSHQLGMAQLAQAASSINTIPAYGFANQQLICADRRSALGDRGTIRTTDENQKKKFYKTERFDSKYKRKNKVDPVDIDVNLDDLLMGRG